MQMKNAISANRMTLVDNLTLTDDLVALEQQGVITSRQKRILSEEKPTDIVKEFLQILPCRPKEMFDRFLDFLKGSSRQHLARGLEESLRGTTGMTF